MLFKYFINNLFIYLFKTEIKYGSYMLDKKKKRINFKKLQTKLSSENKDLECYLGELLDLEVIK